MSFDPVDRRTFLKLMGVSGSGLFLTLHGCGNASLEDGKETLMSYIDPEDFMIPGEEVWYATTCRQCPAGCGLHARVREGRVRKLEGNPSSPINHGRLCPMGQAGLQLHYHPDRLSQPMARIDGKLQHISWEEAKARLHKTLTAAAKKPQGFAFLSGEVGGHLEQLMDALVQSIGGPPRYVYEPLSQATSRTATQTTLGLASPRLELSKAQLVLSFGADFLGPWQSPVHFATEYSQFRAAPRGSLIQVEPSMSLSGANADWWLPIRPQTEVWLALGLANILAGNSKLSLPEPIIQSLAAYDVNTVSRITDVPVDNIQRLAKALRERSPSLVLVGGAAEGQAEGSQMVFAGWLLNAILGNIGQTIHAGNHSPYNNLQTQRGSTAALQSFSKHIANVDNLFIFQSNPLYSAPDFTELDKGFANIRNKVVFANHLDETAERADLLIPLPSSLEEWGSQVPAYNPDQGLLQLQQPIMQPLHAEQISSGDLLLECLNQLDKTYRQWPDFYAYLRSDLSRLRQRARPADQPNPWKLPATLEPPTYKPVTLEQAFTTSELDEAFWEHTVATGLLQLPAESQQLSIHLQTPDIKPAGSNSARPFTLIPSPRLGLYDGRHADLPWIQEMPDQITTIVWDSWAEIHPETAARLKVKTGDIVDITSSHGSIRVKVFEFTGVHPEAVAVPMGQGHSVGRYAAGVGVNPLKMLDPIFDRDTGELALYATQVDINATGEQSSIVKLAMSDSQHKRRLVRTAPADSFNRNEGNS
jgi:anaerobic selenocysteine-containing dehydrogenase